MNPFHSLKSRPALFAVGAFLSFCLAFFWIASPSGQCSASPAGADTGAALLSNIHTINQNEISMAKIALRNTKTPDVEAFAHRMIRDHSAADKQVLSLAKSEGVQARRHPLTAQQKALVKQLKSEKGAAFDKTYMDANRKGHEVAIAMLQKAQAQETDPKIQQLLTRIIPVVEHHEQLARSIISSGNLG